MLTVTIEVDLVLFTAGDTGKIETLSEEMKLKLMILIAGVAARTLKNNLSQNV